jgi:hypothetical protein
MNNMDGIVTVLRLYLVRHGETEANVQGIVVGNAESVRQDPNNMHVNNLSDCCYSCRELLGLMIHSFIHHSFDMTFLLPSR